MTIAIYREATSISKSTKSHLLIRQDYSNRTEKGANFGTYNLNDYQVFLHLISKIGGVDGNRYGETDADDRRRSIRYSHLACNIHNED